MRPYMFDMLLNCASIAFQGSPGVALEERKDGTLVLWDIHVGLAQWVATKIVTTSAPVATRGSR